MVIIKLVLTLLETQLGLFFSAMSAGSDVAYYLDRVREVLANADRGLTDVESNKKMSDVDKRKVRTATLCARSTTGPGPVPHLRVFTAHALCIS